MFIIENVPLSTYSTMRLGGTAAFLTDIDSRDEIPAAIAWAEERQLPVIMIGMGSNIVWRDEGFPGLVLVNKILGVQETTGLSNDHYVTAGAGMPWDDFVADTVNAGLTGIECLSMIPGTVGATPMQNVGAYGAEVSQSIVTIEAYDRTTKQFVTLRGADCDFGYRTSRFKTTDRGRYFISAVTFFLTQGSPSGPFYAPVAAYFAEHHIDTPTPADVRTAVMAIRQTKLPDPRAVANNGSFFGNPVVDSAKYIQLHADYPELAYWEIPGGKVKLSAAWLVDNAGFKNHHDAETGMATWPAQPLVLVNEHATSTAQLLAYKQKIVTAVQQKFGISLEQEPELLP